MNNRLKEIIREKTGGRQTEFATLLGWTPQYIAKLLRGENFGIVPVKTLLSNLPEIDARWLLFGTGTMLTKEAGTELHGELFSNIERLLVLDRYIPIMTADELRYFENCIKQGCQPDFSPEALSNMSCRASERQNKLDAVFSAAQAKSDELCRHRTANK